MNKKKYIEPALEVVTLHIGQQLLAGSTLGTDSTPVNPSASDAPEFEMDTNMFGF